VPFIDSLPGHAEEVDKLFGLVVDAIFGFSFKGQVRPPFDTILPVLKDVRAPVVSVDIPSGKSTCLFVCLPLYYVKFRVEC
jgi:NAD(P)H-hydrate epimerase